MTGWLAALQELPLFVVAQGLALLGAVALFQRLLLARGVAPERRIATILALGMACGCVAGCALLGPLVRAPRVLAGEMDFFARGWPTAYGGLAGAALGSVIAARRLGSSVPAVLDALAPALGLLILVGRLGCFVAGCCFGAPSHAPWAVAYPIGSPAYADQLARRLIDTAAPASLPVHPAPLYEVGLGLLIIGLSALAAKRARRGVAFTAAAVVYAAGRFAIELVRGDPRPMAGGLSMPQWLSIGVLAAALWAWSRVSAGRIPRGPA